MKIASIGPVSYSPPSLPQWCSMSAPGAVVPFQNLSQGCSPRKAAIWTLLGNHSLHTMLGYANSPFSRYDSRSSGSLDLLYDRRGGLAGCIDWPKYGGTRSAGNFQIRQFAQFHLPNIRNSGSSNLTYGHENRAH
jgi:hypothetical protein